MATVIILALAIVIFALQNLEIVNIDFLSFGVRVPLAFLVVTIYLIGMATSSSFLSLIRRSVVGAGIGQLRRSAP